MGCRAQLGAGQPAQCSSGLCLESHSVPERRSVPAISSALLLEPEGSLCGLPGRSAVQLPCVSVSPAGCWKSLVWLSALKTTL